MTFVDFNICDQMASVLYDLDLNFQDQTFQVAILSSKCWENANIIIAIR